MYAPGVRWPWRKQITAPSRPANVVFDVSDPLHRWFGNTGGDNYSGVEIDEAGALALSAVWRSVAVIAGTLASLPLRSLRETESGTERVKSIFDSPGGAYGPTPFEWKETAFAHLLLHGNCFEFHVLNQAGAVIELQLLHPLGVQVSTPTPDEYRSGRLPVGGKWFDVTLDDHSSVRLDGTRVTHVPALCVDGVRGLSPIEVARNSLGIAGGGDRAAGRMFSKGALISGMATPEEDMEVEEAKEARRQIDASVGGWENAASIAVMNRRMNFTPWTMSAVDAQFLQSRQFSIEEIARWWGVHPTLLMQTDKQTSWGTGIEEQNRGLGRTVLSPWAQRFEQRNSRLLPSPRFLEFDFAGLERPSPKDEIELLLKQTGGKPLLTQNEARAIRNLEPLTEPGADLLNAPGPAPELDPGPSDGGGDAPVAE